MIVDSLIEKLEKIEFEKLDYDEILDKQDIPEFDSEWMYIYFFPPASDKAAGGGREGL